MEHAAAIPTQRTFRKFRDGDIMRCDFMGVIA
jgi:hypothetical protein